MTAHATAVVRDDHAAIRVSCNTCTSSRDSRIELVPVDPSRMPPPLLTGHNAQTMLVRRDGEVLTGLRLDKAIARFDESGATTDEINPPDGQPSQRQNGVAERSPRINSSLRQRVGHTRHGAEPLAVLATGVRAVPASGYLTAHGAAQFGHRDRGPTRYRVRLRPTG